jgi:hypothetical protein
MPFYRHISHFLDSTSLLQECVVHRTRHSMNFPIHPATPHPYPPNLGFSNLLRGPFKMLCLILMSPLCPKSIHCRTLPPSSSHTSGQSMFVFPCCFQFVLNSNSMCFISLPFKTYFFLACRIISTALSPTPNFLFFSVYSLSFHFDCFLDPSINYYLFLFQLRASVNYPSHCPN